MNTTAHTTLETDTIINRHVIWAAGAGLIPVPLVGFGAVTAIQIDMIKQLSKFYDVSYSESKGKTWITALGGSFLARIGADMLKAVPGIGTLIGGISMAATSAGTTYAIGQVLNKHYSQGGSEADFNPDDYKEFFQEQFKKGKKKYKNSGKEDHSVLTQLRNLAQMHEEGLINDDEYQRLKEKALDQLDEIRNDKE